MMLRSFTRLKQVSEKRKAKQPARDECVRIVLERAAKKCQAKIAGICAGWANDVHEYHTRGQGGDDTDPENCFAVCRPCHMHIHHNPTWASDSGLMRNKKREAERG